MRVLVTGGTGVVGQSAVSHLAASGHTVRLLSRNADEDARRWPVGVESWPASISDAKSLTGCANDCDLVLHIAGIVAESPPEVTFENTNVEGTRNIVAEAGRGGVGRFIYLSSLGADTGASDYHKSKKKAEEIVRAFPGGWIILRPGNVYGPGDDVVSRLLNMVRTLPVVPVVGGDDPFQPIWVEDLSRAIAQAVERTDLHGRTLDLAGDDTTTMPDIVERIQAVTGRDVKVAAIPSALVGAGAAIAGLVGVELPVSKEQLTMLREGNVIRTPGGNALTAVFKLEPTHLDEGLRLLADSQPEAVPGEGVGALKRKRFWADITGGTMPVDELFNRFCQRFGELTPGHMDLEAEPGTATCLEEGATLTMALPLRGNVQVRVQEVTPRSAVLTTLKGHPLAGGVRFLAEERGEVTRFEVQVYDRPATIPDWIAMRTVGDSMQAKTWESLVMAIISESGGLAAGGVQSEEEALDTEKAEKVEGWLKDLVVARQREEELVR